MMTKDEFYAKGIEGFNRVALSLTVFSDMDTPLSVYLKLIDGLSGEQGDGDWQKRGANSFLLESVVGGERFGRYSFIGLPCRTLLRASGFGEDAQTQVVTNGRVVESAPGNPLDFIAAYQQRLKVAGIENLPRFCGGLAGYFGYDAVRYVEKKLAKSCPPQNEQDLPDILLLQCEEVAVIDNLSGKLQIIVFADPQEANAYEKAQARLKALQAKLARPVVVPVDEPTAPAMVQGDFDKESYKAAVIRAKEFVAQGDFMQVQLGRCVKKRFTASPLNLYRALRTLNPSPYMYYYHFGDFYVVGASPEILVRQESQSVLGATETKVTIRPLAGTRPRGATQEQDVKLEQELLQDAKERAEHVMLIDLARNDVGRIAKTASVKVTDAFCIERYSHVMHIVSNVEGILREGMSNMDVFKATFPAGTLTGAPKVHAMEVIDQLEPVKRGLYGGACGYISFTGDMDIAIAIRTGIIKNQTLYVQASAGIVADSVPEAEWQETENKMRALLRASELVEAGLNGAAINK